MKPKYAFIGGFAIIIVACIIYSIVTMKKATIDTAQNPQPLTPEQTFVTCTSPSGNTLTKQEAYNIALASECGEESVNIAIDTSYCKNNLTVQEYPNEQQQCRPGFTFHGIDCQKSVATGVDLIMNPKTAGCGATCIVDVDTHETYIYWMCTGVAM